MKFENWLEENTIHINDIEYLNDFSYIGIKYKAALKDIYNLLKSIDAVNLVTVYKIKNHIYDYILAFGNTLSVENIFPAVRIINGKYFLNNLTKEEFKSIIVTVGVNDLDHDNFYCRITINPEMYQMSYVSEIEKVLNKDITFYTNLDTLFKEFKKSLKNEEFRSTIFSHYPDYGIIIFPDEETFIEYDNYYTELPYKLPYEDESEDTNKNNKLN